MAKAIPYVLIATCFAVSAAPSLRVRELEAAPPCACAARREFVGEVRERVETPSERMERINSCDYLLGRGENDD